MINKILKELIIKVKKDQLSFVISTVWKVKDLNEFKTFMIFCKRKESLEC